ncbi:MAG: PIN domain-containing protein [Microvirga sp.]|jgi:predicted nucleic acid-binding protein|nr:PIN domain-containing protein [Beijerinckiaceae bacterium]
MPPKPFFDTNVLVYAFLSTDPRHGTARTLAAGGGVFSVQVANEFVDVARRKMRWEWDDVVAMLAAFRAWFGTPVPLTHETHVLALEVARRRGLRIYDALVLSAAKQAGCRILYTEDLQDGQTIEGVLVRNPFVGA